MGDDGADIRQIINNNGAGGQNHHAFILAADGASASHALTNTRASSQTIIDHNGTYRQAQNNELCWDGLRRVHNLFALSDAPATQSITLEATTYVLQASGTGTITITGTASGTLTVSGNHKRLAFTATAGSATFTLSAGTPTFVQVIKTTGESDTTAPMQYVSSSTTYNAGVSGVRYFATTNGYTADGDGVVVEGEGTAISNTWTGLSVPYTSTNVTAYSEDLTQATAWTGDNVTIANDGTLGPDGVGQLQKITDNAANAIHRVYQTHAAGATQTACTVHLLSGGTIPFVRVRSGDGTNQVYADINMATMTIAASGAAGTATLLQAQLVQLGTTAKYTLKLAATYSAGITPSTVISLCPSQGTITAYVGTGQYCYAGFAQHEAGRTECSPYIPNKAAGSTTRQANDIQATLPSALAANPNLTMIVTHRPFYDPANAVKTTSYILAQLGSVSTEKLWLYATSNAATATASKVVAGVGNLAATSAASGIGTRTKWGMRLKQAKASVAVDGTVSAENANTSAPAHNNVLLIGGGNSRLERIEIYTRAMSDSEFSARTT